MFTASPVYSLASALFSGPPALGETLAALDASGGLNLAIMKSLVPVVDVYGKSLPNAEGGDNVHAASSAFQRALVVSNLEDAKSALIRLEKLVAGLPPAIHTLAVERTRTTLVRNLAGRGERVERVQRALAEMYSAVHVHVYGGSSPDISGVLLGASLLLEGNFNLESLIADAAKDFGALWQLTQMAILHSYRFTPMHVQLILEASAAQPEIIVVLAYLKQNNRPIFTPDILRDMINRSVTEERLIPVVRDLLFETKEVDASHKKALLDAFEKAPKLAEAVAHLELELFDSADITRLVALMPKSGYFSPVFRMLKHFIEEEKTDFFTPSVITSLLSLDPRENGASISALLYSLSYHSVEGFTHAHVTPLLNMTDRVNHRYNQNVFSILADKKPEIFDANDVILLKSRAWSAVALKILKQKRPDLFRSRWKFWKERPAA
ncbi:MAG: hypothetical protein Q7R40_17985 [Phaeospirillum sp.]|nr:hypothetical protein [Phaeospirillum sp.]